MFIDISDILKENGLSKEVKLQISAADCGIQDPECDFTEPLSVAVEFTNINGLIRVKGNICAAYDACCARCLEPIQRTIEKNIDEEVLNARTAIAEEDAYQYTGKEVDLGCIVHDAVLLNMPIRHLCAEDCKALCPRCGRNLNQGDCFCKAEDSSSPFDVLEGFVSEKTADDD